MLPTDIFSSTDLTHSHSNAHLITSTKTYLSKWSGQDNLCAKQRTRAISYQVLAPFQELFLISNKKLFFWADPLGYPSGIISYDKTVLCLRILLTSPSINLGPYCCPSSVFPCLEYRSEVFACSLFSCLANRKKSGLCDILQPCCHPPAVRMQGLPLASHLCCGTQILLGMVSWKRRPSLSVQAISLTLCFALSPYAYIYISIHPAFIPILILLLQLCIVLR